MGGVKVLCHISLALLVGHLTFSHFALGTLAANLALDPSFRLFTGYFLH